MEILKDSDFKKEIKAGLKKGYLFFGEEDYLKSFAIRSAEESADVLEAVGHTMLPAGRNCLITGLALNYGESEVASTVLETPVELTAGKVSVLRIKCNLQNTSVLQLATRTTIAADTEVTFTLEKITTE